MTASAGSDAIVYEQNGVHPPLRHQDRSVAQALAIDVVGDFPVGAPAVQARREHDPRRERSRPTGVRAAFEARGDIFTVPADKGDWRNLTKSPGAHDRNPVWSPDGSAARVALRRERRRPAHDRRPVRPQQARARSPLPGAGYFSEARVVAERKAAARRGQSSQPVDGRRRDGQGDEARRRRRTTRPAASFDATWSPDSRWVAYSKSLDSHLRAVFVRSLADAASPMQLTDALADAISPSVRRERQVSLLPRQHRLRSADRLGRDERRRSPVAALGLSRGAQRERAVAAPARDRVTNPLAAPAPRAKPDSILRIDFADIGQRILSLDVPAADYGDLAAGPAGIDLLLGAGHRRHGEPMRRQRYQLRLPALPAARTARRVDVPRGHSLVHAVGRPKEAALLRRRRRGRALGRRADRRTGEGRRRRDERRAARELGRSARRVGGDLPRRRGATSATSSTTPRCTAPTGRPSRRSTTPLLAFVNHRTDLGYLMAQTGGELIVGHSYLTGPGDVPSDPPVSVGLLGADYTVENGHYRIHHIYTGENWNPDLARAAQRAGHRRRRRRLSARGEWPAAHAADERLLRCSRERPVIRPSIRVNSTPTIGGIARRDGRPRRERRRTCARAHGSRTIAARSTSSRAASSRTSGCRTRRSRAITAFTRYFYSQQDKDGAIIDERYNHGGLVADYIVNELDRKPMGYFAMRDGKTWTIAGGRHLRSQGDDHQRVGRLRRRRAALLLPACVKIGPLVGTRTWGGARRHDRRAADDRRRRHHGAEFSVL